MGNIESDREKMRSEKRKKKRHSNDGRPRGESVDVEYLRSQGLASPVAKRVSEKHRKEEKKRFFDDDESDDDEEEEEERGLRMEIELHPDGLDKELVEGI